MSVARAENLQSVYLQSDDSYIKESQRNSPFVRPQQHVIADTKNPIKNVEQVTKDPLEQSIYESYNAFNEVERIQKLENLTQAEQSYYISENVISYLEEFVGKIKVKQLSGILKDDGSLSILGTNVTDMYNHSASLAGRNSREHAEKVGLDLIAEGILAGNNRGVWVSPPKLSGANYGFAFTFLAGEKIPGLGIPLRELLLRYDETTHESIDASKQMYNQLAERVGVDQDSNKFGTFSDFLANPLLYNHEGFEDLEAMYEYLDISPDDVRRSEEFRLHVIPEIQTALNQYIDIIQQMSNYDLQYPDDQFRNLELEANHLIGAMFNATKIVNRKMDPSLYDTEQLARDDIQLQFMRSATDAQSFLYAIQNMAGYESLTIQGGSNCPIVKQTGQSEEMFLSSMRGGLSVSSAMEQLGLESDYYDNYNCPHCNKELSGEYKYDSKKWRTECDHCHKSISCKADKNGKDTKKDVKLNT